MAVTNIDIVYFAEIVSRMRKWQKGFRIHGGKGNLEQVKYWEKKVDAFLAEYEKSKDNADHQEVKSPAVDA